jgi:hypothetical protein
LFHVRHRDALVLSLFDGSFHVIRDLFYEPAWSTSTVDGSDGMKVADSGTFTSEGLSAISRTAFTQAERSDVRFTDVNRVNGMLAHDDVSGTVMWLHEYVIAHSDIPEDDVLLSFFELEPPGLRTLATSMMPNRIAFSSWRRCGKMARTQEISVFWMN